MGPYNHVDFILFEPEKYVDSGVSEESVPPGPVLEDQHRFSPGETWLQLVLPCLPRGRLMFIACAILIYTIYIIYTYIYIYMCMHITFNENAMLHFSVEDQGMDVSLSGGLKQVNPVQSHQGQG